MADALSLFSPASMAPAVRATLETAPPEEVRIFLDAVDSSEPAARRNFVRYAIGAAVGVVAGALAAGVVYGRRGRRR